MQDLRHGRASSRGARHTAGRRLPGRAGMFLRTRRLHSVPVDSNSCAWLSRESREWQNPVGMDSFGAFSWGLWCNVSEPCSFRLSQNLLKSPFFLDVSPHALTIAGGLISWWVHVRNFYPLSPALVMPQWFPVVLRDPGSCSCMGSSPGNRKHQGELSHIQPLLCWDSATASQLSQNTTWFLQRGLTILIWCHPQLLLLYLLMLTPSPSLPHCLLIPNSR